MEEKTLKLLEFDKVKAELAKHATSSLGKELVESLVPFDNFMRVKHELRETKEAYDMLNLGKEPPFGGLSDVRDEIVRASKGAVLDGAELLEISATLRLALRMKQYLESSSFPWLLQLGHRLDPLSHLYRAIEETFDEDGKVADSASPELSRIRKELTIASRRLEEKLSNMIRSSEMQKYLQESLITRRGDRLVIPVKKEYRAQVPGIIHDQSASGATLFIEPASVVELNNGIRLLKEQEGEEVRRILRELSFQVGQEKEKLLLNIETLARLDFAFAKARYAYALKATEPEISTEGFFDVDQARHPLLKGDVVPIDYNLGKDFRTLIITGPNTGGKTVTLKTIGLMILMAQAGLFIPAAEGAKLLFRKAVYADIGDEQSIEQSLSTFSSHMSTIVQILSELGANSLVLLDELGAGTDPTEGAALATAILDYLRSRGVHTVATTHYSELKTYAYSHEGVENASVEFDLQTLKPTYRLAIGIPGKSNAFAISRRLGLPLEIVERGQALLSSQHVQMEDLIGEMETSRRQAEQDRLAAERLRREYSALKDEYEKLLQELQERREEILEQAREEARQLLAETQQELNRILGEVRRLGREELETRVKDYRDELSARSEKLSSKERERPASRGPQDLKRGEQVRIKSLRQTGFVLEPPGSGDEVLVQVGIMRITVKTKDLERLEGTEAQEPAGQAPRRAHLAKAATIRSELDLRGKTVEEGLTLVDKYLDDAFLSSLGRVRLIHGKGTGTLGEAVQRYLAGHPHVKEFRYADPNQGGHGVTVVDLHQPR